MLLHRLLVTSMYRVVVAELQQKTEEGSRHVSARGYTMPKIMTKRSMAPTSHQMFEFATRPPDQRLWQ